MKARISMMLVAIFFLTVVMALPSAKAMELKAGLDIKGQWERRGDKGYFARLKVLSLEGNKVKLAYGVARFGYENITKDRLSEINANISESPGGIKEVKFTGGHSLADFAFEFNPSLLYVKGTWTSTHNVTWQIEMK
jgi:hypothetical protein